MDEFFLAVERGDMRAIRRLMNNAEVNPGAADNFALLSAVKSGRREMVAMLLGDDRVSVTARNNQALMHAMDNRDMGMMEMMLNHGAEVSRESIEKAIEKDLTVFLRSRWMPASGLMERDIEDYLGHAFRKNRVECVGVLYNWVVEPIKTEINIAITDNNIEMLKVLLMEEKKVSSGCAKRMEEKLCGVDTTLEMAR